MTTTITSPAAPEPEDPFTGGKVLDFRPPTGPTGDPTTDTTPENTDDGVHDDSTETARVLVDPPIADDRSLAARITAARNGTRRAVIAPWLANWNEFTSTARWALDHAGHTAAYHACAARCTPPSSPPVPRVACSA